MHSDVGLFQPLRLLQQTSAPGLHDSCAPQKMVPLLDGGGAAVPASFSPPLEPPSELEPPAPDEPDELDVGESSVVLEGLEPIPALFDIGSAPNCDVPGGSNNSVVLAPPHAKAVKIRDSDGARAGRSFIEVEC